MSEHHPWLEPIRAVASAVLADPPPLTDWEAGEGEGEVIDHEVEKLLCDLGWPTRARTDTLPVTVFGSEPHRNEQIETTNRYFPASWLGALADHISKYVQTRDANQQPEVPDRLKLRKLSQGADFDALRDIIEGAWDDAWDELACSIAVRDPYDAIGMDHERYNFAVHLWYGLPNCGIDQGLVGEVGDGAEPLRGSPEAPSYEQRMRGEERTSFASLRGLPSPKWRAWFTNTWNDRVTIHNILGRCGVGVTGQLGVDLLEAGYALDVDPSRMTIEELVSRIEARHRFFASAIRAAHAGADAVERGGDGGQSGFSHRRRSNRPPSWQEMMEMVARLKRDNVQWKEIKEQVEKVYGYRSGSVEALRKHFERWQRGHKPSA